MIPYLKQNKFLLFFSILFSIISSLSYVFIAILLQKIMDTVMAKDIKSFTKILIFSIVYFILLGIFLYLQSLFSKKIICNIIKTMRFKLFDGILNHNIEDYNKENTAYYISIINNDIKLIEDNYLLPLFEIIQYSVIFIASFGLMIYFDLIVTICVIIAILLMIIIPSIFGGMLEKRQNAFSQHLSSFTNILKDLLSGFEIIKSYSMKPYVISKFDKSNNTTINSKYSVDKLVAINEGISATLALFVQIFVIFLSAYFIIIGRTTVGGLLGMVQVSSNLSNPLLMIFANIPKLKSVTSIIEKLNNYSTYSDSHILECKIPTFQKKISIEKLSFSYHNNKEILHDISLNIIRGKKYAIVGKSGCGKTTLIKLLLGYYSNYKGSIYYDENELSQLNMEHIHELSSMIHQNIYIFNETILDNICLHKSYSEIELNKTLEKSGMSQFISQLPNQLLYKVKENGSNLSGGQKQRIAVARALIRNKPLLVLDEGTSAIDMQTAYDIESSLLYIKDLTLLTITHNMKKEVLELYDNIIFMENGKIIEMGSFSNLMNKKSAFFDYFSLKKNKK